MQISSVQRQATEYFPVEVDFPQPLIKKPVLCLLNHVSFAFCL